MEIVPLLVQVGTGIAASAATGGLRAFFTQRVDVLERAIQATCSRFPEIEGAETALHQWTSAEAFDDSLAKSLCRSKLNKRTHAWVQYTVSVPYTTPTYGSAQMC